MIGTRALNSAYTPLTASVGALYYLLTFGLGSQTLGEEYVDIQPYAEATRNFPSRTVGLFTDWLEMCSADENLATLAELDILHCTDDLVFACYPLSQQPNITKAIDNFTGTTSRIVHAEGTLSFTLKTARRNHVCALLLASRKTAAELWQISTDRSSRTIPSYEPLGILLLIPLISSLLSLASSESTSSTSETAIPEIETNSVNPSVLAPTESPQMCTLCLDPRGTHAGTALTECGHGFCWGCLAGLEKVRERL